MQYDNCSPALLLASIFDTTPLETPQPVARTLLITGASGVGKTTWCRELVGIADSRINLGGFISPGVYESGHKTGIDLVALPDWRVRRLAERRAGDSPLAAAPDPAPSSSEAMLTKHWHFISETLEWGDGLLREDAAPDLWVFDELGPLEFLHNTGLHTALDIVSARRYQLAVVVVRPDLLPLARERWPWAEVCDLSQAPAEGWGSA